MKRLVFICLIFQFFIKTKTQQIAKEKCLEYAKAVFAEEESPILMRRRKIQKVSQCGIASVPLIIGGTKAKDKEFPHMAAIGYGDAPDEALKWNCGASLISETFVLTAAHCLSTKLEAQRVRMGIVDQEDSGPEMQERKIVRKILHPNYSSKSKYNDVALLELDRAVEFTAYVRPLCLNVNDAIDEKKAFIAGFGKLEFEEAGGSRHLMKAFIDIFSNEECEGVFKADKFALSKGVSDLMVCAGTKKGEKDACQGDSGGPLQQVLKQPYCMYSLIGVTSFGKFCGFHPAIYTRISKYIPWIEETVWG